MQQSDEGQVRAGLEWAERNNVYVASGLQFVDRGVSGQKNHRTGLEGLREAIRAKQVDIFSTSRLFRRAYKARVYRGGHHR